MLTRIFGVFLLPQWRPFSLYSILHLLWNITVSTIALRDLLSPSYYSREQLSRADISGKPFFLQLYRYNFEWNYVFSYSLTSLYYLATIPRMLPILDSQPISRYYQKQGLQQIALLLSIFTLVDLLTFFGFHVDYLKEVARSSWLGLLKLIINEIALVGEFIYTYLPFSIACYTQTGTLAEMRRIQAEYCRSGGSQGHSRKVDHIERVKAAVKEVARANSRLHQLNSAPLAIYLVTTGIAIVVFCCRLGTDPDYGFFLYGLLVFSYQLYLATLSRKTKLALRAIVAALQRQEMEERLSSVKELLLLKQSSETFEVLKDKHLSICSKVTAEVSRPLVQGGHLLDYYEAEVGVQVFKLFNMDYAFLFTLVLFLLNYSVFILQTKAES